jgi:hypothetical protein
MQTVVVHSQQIQSGLRLYRGQDTEFIMILLNQDCNRDAPLPITVAGFVMDFNCERLNGRTKDYYPCFLEGVPPPDMLFILCSKQVRLLGGRISGEDRKCREPTKRL